MCVVGEWASAIASMHRSKDNLQELSLPLYLQVPEGELKCLYPLTSWDTLWGNRTALEYLQKRELIFDWNSWGWPLSKLGFAAFTKACSSSCLTLQVLLVHMRNSRIQDEVFPGVEGLIPIRDERLLPDLSKTWNPGLQVLGEFWTNTQLGWRWARSRVRPHTCLQQHLVPNSLSSNLLYLFHSPLFPGAKLETESDKMHSTSVCAEWDQRGLSYPWPHIVSIQGVSIMTHASIPRCPYNHTL